MKTVRRTIDNGHKEQAIAAQQTSCGRPILNAVNVALVAIVAVAVLCFCSGCRNSDALKEIIYDQTSENVDYNSEQKYYLNDESATQTNSTVPASETSKDAITTEEKQNLVAYSSKPNATQYTSKKQVWDSNPDYKGLEASESVKFYESDNAKTTRKRSSTSKNNDPNTQKSETSDSNDSQGNSGTGNSAEKGSKSNGTKKKTKKTKKGGGKNGKKQTNQTSTEGDDEVEEKDITSDYADPPKVSRIAAYGSAAVMVQMVGGKGALVAADKELLSSGFSKVFADEGASNIKKGWSDDGSASGIDADAIIASKADTVIVTSSDYQSDMSKAARKKLKKAKITLSIISDPTNSSAITKDVTKIGKMLSDAKNIGNAGETTSIAKEYKTFHNDLVKACNDDKLASDDETVYEQGNKAKHSFGSGVYTLLIDKWDSSVRWKTGGLSMNGAALSYIGYEESPVSYYMQAGGVINNAAANEQGDAGLMLDWQFRTPVAKKSSFKYKSGGDFDTAVWPKKSLDAESLLFSTVASGGSLNSSTATSTAFGDENFSKVVTATQEIKKKFIANSKESTGAYHAYSVDASLSIPITGIEIDGNQVRSCIKSASSDGSIADSAVVVNPHGLFSSWTEGGSVESVLETVWANDELSKNGDVDWKSKVEEFYKTFYRYELTSSDLSTIEEGLEE